MVITPNIEVIREQFPILKREVNGKPLIYLDNGASSQKPLSVIKALDDYYSLDNANIHRGVHYLSQVATEAYEKARKKVQGFVNAQFDHEIIFTKGTTDSINLIAATFPLKSGDEVLISAMEHHSNIVPWQIACEKSGAQLRVMPINHKGELILDEALDMINERTQILAITHVSNSLGTINPIEKLIAKAREMACKTLIDGAQAVPHMKVDVQALDCDFYVFSSHKMFGPTGVGILYGKESELNALPPYQGGGDMIKTVTFEKTTYNELPHKFEAGTPHIAGGIGLGAAVDFMTETGFQFIAEQEKKLLSYATEQLRSIDGLRIIGQAEHKASVISFLVDGTHPYDLGMILDKLGIAIRTGHHCTQPLMDFFNIPGTCRASFALYNSLEEVDLLVEGIQKAAMMLR